MMAQQDRSEPDHISAAELFAQSEKLDVDTFLSQYFKQVGDQTDRFPDCLKSSEIQLLLQERLLAPERVTHVELCIDCASIAKSVMPRGMDFNAFLSEVRKNGEDESTHAESELGDKKGAYPDVPPIRGHVEMRGVSNGEGAIRDLDLTVGKGVLCALLGPSNSGASTVLRMIAGHEAVSSGSILVDGMDVTRLRPDQRRVAMLFQSYALYPHLTVRENIAFSLSVTGVSRTELTRRVDEVAAKLQLAPLMERRPAQLSGGQRQRVAIARELVRKPEVFLFDETAPSVDAVLGTETQLELANLRRTLGTTTIYSTRDQAGAMKLADRICVLREGRVVQAGAPFELYSRPDNRFVAEFIGSPTMNFLSVTARHASGRELALAIEGASRPDEVLVESRYSLDPTAPGPVQIGIRPEHIALADPSEAQADLAGRVRFVEQLGESTVAHIDTPVGQIVVGNARQIRANELVGLVLDRRHVHVFAADGRVL